MTQFSPDNHVSPRGFGAEKQRHPGPVGRPSGGAGGHQPGGGGRKPHQGGKQSGGHKIGRPGPVQAPQQAPAQDDPTDLRHIHLLAAYDNMKRLGREQSFGTWAQQAGHAADFMPEGRAPFDFLEDF